MASELKLSGSAGGRIIVQGNDTITTDQTFTFPDTGGELATRTAGNILQVVYGGTSSQVSLTTTTYVDSNLAATITPSSSTSKVLVLVDQSCQWNNPSGASGGIAVRLLRNSTVIEQPPETSIPLSDYIANATQHYLKLPMTVLDSPSTTSAVTYKTQGRVWSGVAAEFQASSVTKGASRIVLMEVAA